MSLTAKQERCIEFMVNTDLTQKEIAKELKLGRNTITKWKKQEEFQEALKSNTDSKLKTLAQKAVRRLDQLMDSKVDSVALNACKEVLNKSGYKETDKVEQTVNVIDLEVEE